jgi:hypothetical protein
MRTMFGLHWVRARQRDLTKAVLALFCLAWLQASAMPCAMADDGAGMAGQIAAAPHHACQYCPPATSAPAGIDQHGACLYPHGPQVDARITPGLFFALPVTAHIATLDAQPIEQVAVVDRIDPGVPRTPLSVSFCRYLE